MKDLTPGFALEDVKTGEINGYDVDMIRAIARKLDVRLEITPIKEGTSVLSDRGQGEYCDGNHDQDRGKAEVH